MYKKLFSEIEERLKKGDVFICIAGASCSGKTTLAQTIQSTFYNIPTLVLCEDSWYKDLKELTRDREGYYNLEAEESFHLDEFSMEINNLIYDGQCNVPKYEITQNKRIPGFTPVKKEKIIIFEGLHTVNVLSRLHYKDVLYIYIDTDVETCLKRRIHRDSRKLHIGPSIIEEAYMTRVRRNYKPYEETQKDIVITEGGFIFK